ncbi:MAG: ligand-binding sensor domain-containing protein [Anaerolineae bacterium]
MGQRRWNWVGLLLCACLVAACGLSPQASPTPATTTAEAQPQPSPSSTTPSESALAPTTGSTRPAVGAGTLTHYPSLNEVKSLAFEGDDRLWVGTQLGLVAWDLTTDTPTHVTFGACPTDLSFCGADHQWVHDVAVVEDDAGDVTVWAATTGGVRRLEPDGRTTTFTVVDGLPDTVAVSLAVAPDGDLWVGTAKGLASFDGEAWHVFRDLPGYGAPIWAVDVEPTGLVWLSTHTEGVIRYDPIVKVWERYGTEAGFPVPSARALAVGPDGDVWVHIGYDHVYRFDGATWAVAYEAGGGQWVCDFAFGELPAPYGIPSTSPLIATCGAYHAYGNGIAYADAAGWSYVTASDGLPSNGAQAVAVSSGGVLAVGTDRGLSVYQKGAWRTLRHGPTLNDVTSVAATSQGVWFAFGDDDARPAGGGLARFEEDRWTYVKGIGPGEQMENVRILSVSPAGGLWAAAGCVVARLGIDGWETVATCDTISGNVRAIGFESSAVAWVATDFNAYRLGEQSVTYNDMLPIAMDVGPQGRVWIAHSPFKDGGLSYFDGAGWVRQTSPITVVSSLAVMPNGRLWIAGEGRLFTLREDGWAERQLPVTGVRMLKVGPGPSGPALWAVGDTAVAQLGDAGWQTVADVKVAVADVAFEPDGGLWLATAVGAVHIRP